ncbi:MAG: hypothetical protein MRY83_20605, partial [Flavobacteriales bacterium]|nr:hypothetical protein [Flavobacteriales bacterium]
MKHFTLALCLCVTYSFSFAQTDTTFQEEEIDWSQYENLSFADENVKRYCSAKIFNLSPQRLISVGWESQLGHEMSFTRPDAYLDGDEFNAAEKYEINHAGGIRASANIPTVSNNKIIWQLGFNYLETNYEAEQFVGGTVAGNFGAAITEGLKSLDLNTTVFKPLNEEDFIIFQGSVTNSGNYTWENFQDIDYLRYSAAALWGKRKSDYLQWAVGLARTYRVGELNYIPIVLYNYTSKNRKWGTEILFPARAHYRRTFNPRNLLLAGYELEGQSYRLNDLSPANRSWELRRGELKLRLEYQKQIKGFVWFAFQAGYR